MNQIAYVIKHPNGMKMLSSTRSNKDRCIIDWCGSLDVWETWLNSGWNIVTIEIRETEQ